MLKCNDPIIHELSKKEKASPFHILTAQAAVVEAMERLWYKDYLAYLSKEEKQEEGDSSQEGEEELESNTPNQFRVSLYSIDNIMPGVGLFLWCTVITFRIHGGWRTFDKHTTCKQDGLVELFPAEVLCRVDLSC